MQKQQNVWCGSCQLSSCWDQPDPDIRRSLTDESSQELPRQTVWTGLCNPYHTLRSHHQLFPPLQTSLPEFLFHRHLARGLLSGRTQGTLGGVLTTLLVITYVYYFPSSFMAALTERDLWMKFLVWSSFLILTGAVVGQLISRLKTEVQQLRKLRRDLQTDNEKLEKWLAKLAALDESPSP